MLIDATTAAGAETVVNSIKKLGFDPANIKYILISHGHNDHFGGAGRIKQMAPNARVGVSAPTGISSRCSRARMAPVFR